MRLPLLLCVLTCIVPGIVGSAGAQGHLLPGSDEWMIAPGGDEFDCPYEIVWEQVPDDQSGLSSQYDPCYPFESEVADDFTYDGSTVVAVEWWGVYWCGSPIPPDNFRIRIYTDDAGAPGSVAYEEIDTEYHEFRDPDFNKNRYCILLDTPFEGEIGKRYWLACRSQGCINPQYGQATGSGNGLEGAFQSAFFGFADWVPHTSVFGIPYESAFRLRGDPVVPVESASWSRVKEMY